MKKHEHFQVSICPDVFYYTKLPPRKVRYYQLYPYYLHYHSNDNVTTTTLSRLRRSLLMKELLQTPPL